MKSKKFSLVIKESIKDFKKTIVVDSDKSTSIRSFLLGSISQGISSVKNVLESEDIFSSINCLKSKLKWHVHNIQLGIYNLLYFAKLNNNSNLYKLSKVCSRSLKHFVNEHEFTFSFCVNAGP